MTLIISQESKGKARIALVAFSSLGDGLLYLMVAYNLRLNGYNVTYFGDIANQFRDWFPMLDIQPYPPPSLFDEAFNDFDLVIMSPPQFVRDRLDACTLEQMKQKWLLVCLRAPETWHFDHWMRLRNRCSPEVFDELKPLLCGGGAIRYRKFRDESVVDITLDFLRTQMRLQRTEREVPFKAPEGLTHRKYPRRIVVSPDSANPEKKDWAPASFLKLCDALAARAYEPVIVVAPAKHAEWSSKVSRRYPTPCFQDINALASFIYESGAVIANDSGNGHLASFLGVPVITIYRNNNPLFHWRPGWGEGKVIGPWLRIPWFGRALWSPFVRQSSIISALEEMICPNKPGKS